MRLSYVVGVVLSAIISAESFSPPHQRSRPPAYLRTKVFSDIASDYVVANSTELFASDEDVMVMQTPRFSPSQARTTAIFAAAIYGTNFAAVKEINEILPLQVSAVGRFTLAAVALTGFALWKNQKRPSALTSAKEQAVIWDALKAGGEVGLWYWLGYTAQAAGLLTAPANKSAFFNALAVLVVPVLDACFRPQSTIFSRSKFASIGLAVLGVGLLELNGDNGLVASSADAICLMQALFFGIGYWRLDHHSNRDPLWLTVGQLWAVALASWMAMVSGGDWHIPSTWNDSSLILLLAWTGLSSTALALYLETLALQAISATELTVLMTSVSVFGAGISYVTLGETLSTAGMLGGLLIVGSCLLSSSSGASSVEDQSNIR